jgi:glycine/D-amino acid oxidase-like deaminating enzyme/nitrite reductase/ring-hydroxylating ferredoxin subunit
MTTPAITSSTVSLWLDRPEPISDEPLPAGDVLDDVIVGAGITGLTTALLLARSGRRVAVVEGGVVGSLASGNTTGKVSLLQGTKISRMLGYQSAKVTRAYIDGNREGQQWLLNFCAEHGVPVQLRDAVTYASSPEQRSALDRELRATQEVGLDTHLADDLDVPFPQFGGVVLPDQVQLDPLDALAALVSQIRVHGGSVHQRHRVVKVSYSGERTVTLEDGTTLRAGHVVLATGTPILDRGLYFAKLEPLRSYVLAFDAPAGWAPDGMYLSAGSPGRSIRNVPRDGGTPKLLVGGNGHGVGRTSSEREQVDALRGWTAQHFPGTVETHAWSAQDYRSHDSFPYVGALPRGGGRIFVATGFDKWGLASGVMAARSISAQILDQPPSWQRVMGHRVTRPSGVAHAALMNAKVGLAATRSAVAGEVRSAPEKPADGDGRVGRRGVVPTGVSTVGGTTCAVRAICTHLGGVLAWNDNERTWDCPLHGSRFGADGSVIEGPAVHDLHRLQDDAAEQRRPSS